MKKRILVFGGTMFIGRAIVERLIATYDYEITLYNRNKSNTELFPDLPRIKGDREQDDYTVLTTDTWDVVVDCSGYYPHSFTRLLSSLSGRVGRYIFISTMSVFDLGGAGMSLIDERYPTIDCNETDATSPLPAAYGAKKAAMERILHRYSDMQPIMLRPAFLYGRYDYTERFYYWIYQARHRDHILIPAGEHSISLTYIDDLVNMVYMCVDGAYRQSIYHTISQPSMTIQQIVSSAARMLKRNPTLHPVTDVRLVALGYNPSDLPLHFPIQFQVSGQSIVDDYGLSFASWEESLQSYINHCEEMGWATPNRGLSEDSVDDILTKQ